MARKILNLPPSVAALGLINKQAATEPPLRKILMIKLTDHINQNHGGNKAAFARSIGIKAQNVNKMLESKKGYYVLDDKVIQVCFEIQIVLSGESGEVVVDEGGPGGSLPKHVAEWMIEYGLPWQVFKCEIHPDHWITKLGSLFPYHMEMCKCDKCQQL